MKKFLLFPAMLYAVSTFAQCHVNRYLEPVFESERIAENIVYQDAWALSGLCLSETSITNDDYVLDIYQPVDDVVANRPCIVFAHGGSFMAGNKQTNPVPAFCHRMAERGFVVVSINYRKCFNPLSSNSSIRAVYRAVQDMNSAIRYMKANAEEWGIDTSMVFAGGNSAGAIMALQSAYLNDAEREQGLPATYNTPDLGCLNCTGYYQMHSSKPKAVINLWGAIADTAWIRTSDYTPVISFHGTADEVVFYDTDHPFSFPLFPQLSGSGPVHQRLEEQNIPGVLHTLADQPHEAWNDSAIFDFIVDESAVFLNDHFLKPAAPVLTADTLICLENPALLFYNADDPNITHCISTADGEITGFGEGMVEVNFPDTGVYNVHVWARNQWGALSDTATITIHVIPTPEPFEIVASGDTLLAPEANSWQWYLNGEPIPGGTTAYFVPAEAGMYNVQIADHNGCSANSTLYNWTPLSSESLLKDLVVIYPNPSRGWLRIEGIEQGRAKIDLHSADGKLVWSAVDDLPGELRIDRVPPGLYILRIQNPVQTVRVKVQIQL